MDFGEPTKAHRITLYMYSISMIQFATLTLRNTLSVNESLTTVRPDMCFFQLIHPLLYLLSFRSASCSCSACCAAGSGFCSACCLLAVVLGLSLPAVPPAYAPLAALSSALPAVLSSVFLVDDSYTFSLPPLCRRACALQGGPQSLRRILSCSPIVIAMSD
jgi:hypothetical protein